MFDYTLSGHIGNVVASYAEGCRRFQQRMHRLFRESGAQLRSNALAVESRGNQG